MNTAPRFKYYETSVVAYSPEYQFSVNGGPWVDGPLTVSPGDKVRAQRKRDAEKLAQEAIRRIDVAVVALVLILALPAAVALLIGSFL